jgi:hypothetical protein
MMVHFRTIPHARIILRRAAKHLFIDRLKNGVMGNLICLPGDHGQVTENQTSQAVPSTATSATRLYPEFVPAKLLSGI